MSEKNEAHPLWEARIAALEKAYCDLFIDWHRRISTLEAEVRNLAKCLRFLDETEARIVALEEGKK